MKIQSKIVVSFSFSGNGSQLHDSGAPALVQHERDLVFVGPDPHHTQLILRVGFWERRDQGLNENNKMNGNYGWIWMCFESESLPSMKE